MAQFENPFPGMNPFLELRWPDAHVTLIGYIRDALSEELPPDLSVRAEERVTVTGTEKARDRDYQADVAVRSVVPGFSPHSVSPNVRMKQPSPLRENDPDVPLDIQPLIGRCYRTGRYWQLSGPDRLPADLPEDDRRWAFERLSAE